jgi:hypothetical protein
VLYLYKKQQNKGEVTSLIMIIQRKPHLKKLHHQKDQESQILTVNNQDLLCLRTAEAGARET